MNRLGRKKSTRPHALQAVDDDALAGLEAGGDDALALGGVAEGDLAPLRLVVRADDDDEALALVGADGALAHEDRRLGPRLPHAQLHELAGHQAAVLVAEHRAHAHRAAPRVDLVVDELQPADTKAKPADLIGEIFHDVSANPAAAAAKTLAYLKGGNSAETFIDAARRLVFLKGNDSHDYKFSSAVLEDYFHASPAWRDLFLAASVYKLNGAGEKDIARRLGEDVPTRAEILAEPAAWREKLGRFPRLLLAGEKPEIQFGFFPPEKIDRDLNRLRSLLAGAPPTIILCDNEGQLERLEELLDGSRRATGTQ